MDIAGKRAVVTGAGSGIGQGIAAALAERGADVVLADINLASLKTTAAMVEARGRRVRSLQVDVTSPEAVERMADEAWASFGGLELVFNNAGVVGVGEAHKATQNDLMWTYGVNTFGVCYGSLSFIRRFLEHDVQGWICNTGSESAIGVCAVGAAVYTGSKHAVLGMTDALRAEYAGRVGFSVLCPGIVKTNLWNAGRNRSDSFGGSFEGPPAAARAMNYGLEPSEVGRHVVECVAKEEFYIFTHPHVRDIARERWEEIDAAMTRQWPQGPTESHHSTFDVQAKIMAEAGD